MAQQRHTSSFFLHPLACAAALVCLLAAPAWAQTSAPVPATQVARLGNLKEVVISGSRSEQDKDELPVSIDVINRQDMESGQIRDIRDVARELPNVSVQRAPARFTLAGQPAFGRDQNAGFNIRGLDGNRVLMLVDGIRQPRSYVFSANAFGRDYLDIGLIQRIEVVRGATSALYGSDGMAGLVNFITVDPSAFLRDGKTLGGTASIGYDGDDQGTHIGATVAGRASDSLQWLIGANVTRSDGLKNMGSNDAANVDRTTPNPERDKGRALMGKLVFTPGGGQRHVLTFEHVDKNADYNLLTAIAKPPLASTSTLAANAFTDMKRNRLTWDGRWRPQWALADELQAVLSVQTAESREYSFEDRNTAADRVRDTSYKERTVQANLQGGKTLRMGNGAAQRLTYGLDHVRTQVTTLQTGLTPAAGESFPLKRFPDTRESSTAVYLQDEFILGPWSLTPGVRFDHFSLDADQAGFSPPASTPAASLSGSATSPKFGVLYRVDPAWSVYGNYAAGFKAPNAGQVNAFFENLTQFYKSIPNPNLKPEKSQNVEVGLRGRLARVSFDVAAFTGRYKDFIEENRQVGGNMTAANPTIFQTVNIGNVRISGFEVKGDVDAGRFDAGRLSVPFSYGQTRGTDTNTNKPVNSINPARLNVGLRFDAPRWSARLDVTHRAGKDASDIDSASLVTAPAVQFATPSATTLDLSGQWRFSKDLRLTAGVYNLTNRKYWNWSDVRGVSSTQSTLDAWTQPGRYWRVSLIADF